MYAAIHFFQGNYITKFKPEVLTANNHYTKEEKQESGSGTINVGSQCMLKKKMVKLYGDHTSNN